MNKHNVIATTWALLALLSAPAMAAGFVDERSKPGAAPASPAAGAGAASTVAPVQASTPAGIGAAAAAKVAEPEPPKFVYQLRTGEPIHTELKRWADHYGWDLYWYHGSSWKTLRETAINKGPVEDAVAEVIDILRSEGKPVQLRISEGNRVMEVLSTEVRND